MHACGLALWGLLICCQSASTETLHGALARAYMASPTLNAQRAQVRAVDETVPEAQAGLRPKVRLDADAGVEHTRDRITKRDKETSTEIEFDNSGDNQSGTPMARSKKDSASKGENGPKKDSTRKGKNGKNACRESRGKQKKAFPRKQGEEKGAKPGGREKTPPALFSPFDLVQIPAYVSGAE